MAEKLDMKSMDITQDNIAKIKFLFGVRCDIILMYAAKGGIFAAGKKEDIT